jgi:hypothetical protein
MNAAQRINQTSGDDEYYTPGFILAAARTMLTGISLDPASSPQANKSVGAARIYTREDDGLSKHWHGRIWLNHPFGRVSNPLWINKLFVEYDEHRVTEAICITFASTSEAWFKPLLYYPQCFLVPRTNYLIPTGEVKRGVTKGSVVTYLGKDRNDWKRFANIFAPLGVVKVLYE